MSNRHLVILLTLIGTTYFGYYQGCIQGQKDRDDYYVKWFNSHTFRPRLTKVSFVLKDKDITIPVEYFEGNISTIVREIHGIGINLDKNEIKMFYNGGVWESSEYADFVERHVSE